MLENLDLLSVSTKNIFNDRWLSKSEYIKSSVQSASTVPYKNFVDFAENISDAISLGTKLSQKAFLHVVAETVYHYPCTYVSEKSIKPILSKRPFVIVGPPRSLENLRSLGFRTFGDFWDERYDDISDPDQRVLAVVDIIESICSKSISELQDLCIDMADVLNFNFKFYLDNFEKNELAKLEQFCIDNLKR